MTTKRGEKLLYEDLTYQGGFSLTELLVVIFIIALMTAIVLPNYRPGGEQLALQRAANKLALDIRRAQEMAMSAKEICINPPCPPNSPIVPKTGYGVYLEAKESNICAADNCYILFADTDGDNEFYTSPDTEVEPPYIILEKGVIISDINTAPKKVSINFKPPDPSIKIKYQLIGGEQDQVTITLALETNILKTKTVTINKAGLIEIQ